MKILAMIFVILFSSIVYPQTKQPRASDSSVVLTGEDYAIALTVPGGWILEPREGTSLGTIAILRPEGKSGSRVQWGNPDSWIAVSIATKRTEGKKTISNLIAYFAKLDSQWEPTATILIGPNLFTKDKKPAIIKQAKGDRYAATAFIDDETIVTVITLFRFSQEEFTMGYPTFKRLVESYGSVAVEKKPAK